MREREIKDRHERLPLEANGHEIWAHLKSYRFLVLREYEFINAGTLDVCQSSHYGFLFVEKDHSLPYLVDLRKKAYLGV